MKILDDAIIKDKYDVIVIGAGNGGLTAAAMLANRGVDVLVIEQHYIPGGCVTSLRRKDITCDIGAAILFGFADIGYNPHTYIMNELKEPIDMVWHESTFAMYWQDKKVVFWKDVNKFIKELTAAFPSKEEDLKAYYDYMFKMHEGITAGNIPTAPSEVGFRGAMKMFMDQKLNLLKLLPLLKMDGKEIFDKYLADDTELLQFFDVCMGLFTCTKLEETPAAISVAMFADMHRGGACYPVGSPQMLPNKMERAIERLGGQIIQRHLVEEIIFDTSSKKPKAIGVRLDNGLEIQGDYILSNANIYNMFGKLVKPELVDPVKMEFYQNMVPTTGSMMLYIGVDKEVIPKDKHNIEFLIEDKTNFFNNIYVFIPSLDDPSICPNDAHSLTVIVPEASHKQEWPRPSDPFYQSDEYNKLKEKWANYALDKLDAYYPGLKQHLRFCEIATPSTIERFTLKYKGNVAGPAQMIGQDMFKRPWARLKDYKNLYYCGDSTVMGEGVVSTAASGVSAANVILKDGKLGKRYFPKKIKNKYVNLLDIGPKRIDLPRDNEELTDATAQRLSQQCQWCEEDKCRNKCPANLDVLNFIRRIESENYDGAAKLLREMNPLAETCGYICPSERFCESECYRLDFDKKSTQIRRLQKWVCQKAGENGFNRSLPKANGKKVAIVGAGPAGISCAHYLARLGFKIELFDKKEKIGGMLTNTIPSFRLPREVIERELKGILFPSVNLNLGMALGKDILLEDLSKDYDAVFLAPGLWKGRVLDLPGLDKKEVLDALTIINAYNNETKLDLKENILVIGGGSVAADTANVLNKLGVKHIKLICLESEEEMPMLEHELNELKQIGVEIINSLGPKEVKGGKLSCIQCTSVFDNAGNFCPEFDQSVLQEVEFDQIIMAIGQSVEDSLAQYLEKEFGSIKLKIDPNSQLVDKTANIYAGGDLIRGAGTVVQSVADGRRAAKAIQQKLNLK